MLFRKKGKSEYNSGTDEASTYDHNEYDDIFYSTEKSNEPAITISTAGQKVRWGAIIAGAGIITFTAYLATAAIIRKVSLL